jgi:hypothetical protein
LEYSKDVSELKCDSKRNSIAFGSFDDTPFSIEEVTGMIFEHTKEQVLQEKGLTVRDCVITVSCRRMTFLSVHNIVSRELTKEYPPSTFMFTHLKGSAVLHTARTAGSVGCGRDWRFERDGTYE